MMWCAVRKHGRGWAHGLAVVLALAAPLRVAEAAWTVNGGYHNPVFSTYGLNFLYLGSNWGFETGLGWVDLKAQSDNAASGSKTNGASVGMAGDVNLKYVLGSGKIRPYGQAGVGLGLGAAAGKTTGFAVGTGAGFLGLGLLLGTPDFYLYGSGNVAGSSTAVLQAGVGFGL